MIGYLSYFKVRLIAGLQYKVSAIAGLATAFFWAIMFCCIYGSFYSNATIPDMSFKAIITYTWLKQAFLSLTYMNDKDSEILNSITDGTVAYELARPYNLFSWWYIKILAHKFSAAFLKFLPVLLVGLIMPKPYNLSLPNSFPSFILFVISLILGAVLLCGILMIIHSVAFFTINYKGIFSISTNVMMLLSGYVIPIPLLPNIVQKLTFYLPFRLLSDSSYRIYSGNINIPDAIFDIKLQLIWIVIIIVIGYLIMNKALKKVSVQGG